MDNNDKEKDIFIKYNLSKHNEVPEKIDNLFNNFVKEEEKMKEEKIVKEQAEQKSKIKWPIYKKALGFAACFTILFAGAHIYATSQGYDNIFFLIKHVAEGGKVTDKNEILSDRDITISYSDIEIGNGIKLQVNRLSVKDNKAKLTIRIDKQKEQGSVTPLSYKVTNKNGDILGELKEGDIHDLVYSRDIELDNFEDDIKVIKLEIYNRNNELMKKLSIDLESRFIEIDESNSKVSKISEIELKEYLSAFALLNYNNTGEHNSYESANERKLLAAGKLWDIVLYDKYPVQTAYYEVDKMNELVKSFTDVPIENGLIKVEDLYFSVKESDGKKHYAFNQFDGYPTAICLSVDDISYSNGIYTVKFTYIYPSMDDYTSNNLENIERYQSVIELQYNEDSQFSKYFVKNIGETKVVQKGENEEDTLPIDNNEGKANKESCDHYYTVKNLGYSGHTTLDGTHTKTCTKCGDTITEKHNFQEWNDIGGGAYTLWCKDCKRYVYTTNYDLVKNSGYPVKENESIGDSAQSISWTEYWGTGIKMQIPTDFTKTLDYRSALVDNGINGHLASMYEGTLEDSKGTPMNIQLGFYYPDMTPTDDEIYNATHNNDGSECTKKVSASGETWYIRKIQNLSTGALLGYTISNIDNSTEYKTLRQYKLYSDEMNVKIENVVSYMINTTTLHSF
ncbi:MAG: hypothetical protein IKF52_03370 [Clostridia bacterium]|nr:hypothetical protein [Clostridia bacterium]